jgi:pyruvate formate lyase activating enzyme
MHQAKLFKPLNDGRVHCRLCSHYCVIDNGEYGKCLVRTNRGGALYTEVYDKVAALNLDPIEKKPLFHFLPGTMTLSFATQGCNLKCSFCQNHSLSQAEPGKIRGREATPEQLVQAALNNRAKSISYTYSEPTIFFELMQDTARLARRNGLLNVMVSNGFQSEECLDELSELIDAANIDLKAYTGEFYKEQCGAKLEPVKKNLKRMVEMNWWLEVTTLVIPGLNDGAEELDRIAEFISGELGSGVPWHVSRFHPDYTMLDRPATPVSALERALEAGKRAGLHYVYAGNVPGHGGEHTICPDCGAQVISRRGFTISGSNLEEGKCASCGREIAGFGLDALTHRRLFGP